MNTYVTYVPENGTLPSSLKGAEELPSAVVRHRERTIRLPLTIYWTVSEEVFPEVPSSSTTSKKRAAVQENRSDPCPKPVVGS